MDPLLNRLLLGCTLATLAACSTIDRVEMSRFEPDGVREGTRAFRFYARADSLVYRNDSPDGEAERMRWLERYVRENAFCKGEYIIESRDVVAINTGLATAHDLFYKGRCKN